MRGAAGCDEGTDGGVVCGGATGVDGFTSAGDFAAAGRTGFGSAGAGGTGSFCAGVVAGAIGVGGGAMGAGSCGFCAGACGSGFLSETGNDTGAGSFTDVGKSTRGAATGVSFIGGAVGTAGRWAGSPATGAVAWTAVLSWRLRSATSRWKEACTLEFSSASWSRFSRSFLYLPSRTSVMKGVAMARSAKSTTISSTRGMGHPWGA